MNNHHPTLGAYLTVFAALAVLLAATVILARIPLAAGWMNVALALAIATAKAVLIALYFMHLRYTVPLVRLIAGVGIVWGVIGATLTMADYLTRGWNELPSTAIDVQAIDRYAPHGKVGPTPSRMEE